MFNSAIMVKYCIIRWMIRKTLHVAYHHVRIQGAFGATPPQKKKHVTLSFFKRFCDPWGTRRLQCWLWGTQITSLICIYILFFSDPLLDDGLHKMFQLCPLLGQAYPIVSATLLTLSIHRVICLPLLLRPFQEYHSVTSFVQRPSCPRHMPCL